MTRNLSNLSLSGMAFASYYEEVSLIDTHRLPRKLTLPRNDKTGRACGIVRETIKSERRKLLIVMGENY